MGVMGMDGAVRYDGLKEAAATVDAEALNDARFGFERAQPHRSARRVFYVTQIVLIAAVIAGFVWAVRTAALHSFVISPRGNMRCRSA